MNSTHWKNASAPEYRNSADIDEDGTAFYLHGIGLQIDADRGAQRLSGLVVEPAIVLGAFDYVVHDQPLLQMHLLVGAKSVGGKIFAVRRPVDSKGPVSMIETDQIFFLY